MSRPAVLIPLKDFGIAKERLTLAADTKAEFVESMAAAVLSAAAPLPVWVVCDDPDVASWANRRGANVAWRGGGLNAAVQAASETLLGAGFTRVVVAHGDLPNAKSFDSLLCATNEDHEAIALVTDRHGDGTNVLSLPAGTAFQFQYGVGSYNKHLHEASRLGLKVITVEDSDLALDIDRMEDLDLLRKQK